MDTYSKLFFKSNTFCQSSNDIIIEVLVASKIKGFKFLKLSELLEDLTHSRNIENFIVLESHLH